MLDVQVYTDGSSKGNPGPSGIGVVFRTVIRGKEHIREYKAWIVGHQTNNRVELNAILVAVEQLKAPVRLTVITDSRNCIGWLSKDWQCNIEGNLALVNAIKAAIDAGGHEVQYQHVNGHAGVKFNELADRLATEASAEAKERSL